MIETECSECGNEVKVKKVVCSDCTEALERKDTDVVLRLGEVERRLARVMMPPSRPTLISYIKSGNLNGYPHPINGYYLVYESSVDEFIEQNYKPKEKLAA